MSAPRAGFTIVEVVLAMGILLIGLTAVLGMLSFGAGMARTAELRTHAAESVDAVVADLALELFPVLEDGTAGEPVPVEGRLVPGRSGLVYDARAVPRPGGPRRGGRPIEYRVDVELRWSVAGTARAHRFTTLLLREVPFGVRARPDEPPAEGSTP
jgi:hypothetical protein